MKEARIPLKSGDEYDALTGWKRYCFWQPGERKKIKRGYRKRLRKSYRKFVKEIDESS